LLVTAHFNKKKMLIEMTARQTCPAVEKNAKDKVLAGYLKPTPWFEVSTCLSSLCFRTVD